MQIVGFCSLFAAAFFGFSVLFFFWFFVFFCDVFDLSSYIRQPRHGPSSYPAPSIAHASAFIWVCKVFLLRFFFYYFFFSFLSFWVWLTGIWLWQFQSLHSSCSPFSGNFDSFVKSFYCDLLQSCKSNAAKRKSCEQIEGGGWEGVQLEFPIDICARDLERMLRINY